MRIIPLLLRSLQWIPVIVLSFRLEKWPWHSRRNLGGWRQCQHERSAACQRVHSWHALLSKSNVQNLKWEEIDSDSISNDDIATEPKTPLEVFSDNVETRIDEANRVALDCVIRHTDNPLSSDLFSVFSWRDIQNMSKTTMNASTTEEEDLRTKRMQFATAFAKAGMVVVSFDTDDIMTNPIVTNTAIDSSRSPVSILSSTWSTLRDFFSVVEDWNLNAALHQQCLPGSASGLPANESNVGYNYVQTYLDAETGRVRPSVIEDTIMLQQRLQSIGDKGEQYAAVEYWKKSIRDKLRPPQDKAKSSERSEDDAEFGSASLNAVPTSRRQSVIEECFFLLSEISIMATNVALCGALDQNDANVIQQQLSILLRNENVDANEHENGFLPGTSMQRLAQYITDATQPDSGVIEGLTGHTDWSLITAIPVSPVPGLHIWSQPSWFSPEDMLHQINDDDNSSSMYCILMAGKWLEILTEQRIPSCIHRVVSREDAPSRLSAPFFLRPVSKVAEQIKEVPHGYLGSNEAMTATDAAKMLREHLLEINP